MKLVFSSLCVFLLFFAGYGELNCKEICGTSDGVRVCAQMKGPCDLRHLLPREKSEIKMEMIQISIFNRTNRWVRIVPENFYGVTQQGIVITMDAPFYSSIELRTKLQKRELGPMEEAKGFLFFPTSFGLIRTLVYGGDPFFEIMLY